MGVLVRLWCVEKTLSISGDFVAVRSRVTDMKKPSLTSFVVWVIMVIWLHAHVSIGAMSSKANDTISLCDGSVEDCLIVHHHLDSPLPTISSSHLRRILDGSGTYRGHPILRTPNPARPTFDNGDDAGGYRQHGVPRPPGKPPCNGGAYDKCY